MYVCACLLVYVRAREGPKNRENTQKKDRANDRKRNTRRRKREGQTFTTLISSAPSGRESQSKRERRAKKKENKKRRKKTRREKKKKKSISQNSTRRRTHFVAFRSVLPPYCVWFIFRIPMRIVYVPLLLAYLLLHLREGRGKLGERDELGPCSL